MRSIADISARAFPFPSSKSSLRQALALGGDILHASRRRYTHHLIRVASHARHLWRPAHLPLYVMAGVVGFAVVLLVMSAWLRVILPASNHGARKA